MKKIIAAALLTMPMSLFAEGGATTVNVNANPAPAATTTTVAPAATVVNKVSCVGKTGSALTDDQKKALETAGVKSKTFKHMKATDVDSADKCAGSYTIENGTASKVMHKKHDKK